MAAFILFRLCSRLGILTAYRVESWLTLDISPRILAKWAPLDQRT